MSSYARVSYRAINSDFEYKEIKMGSIDIKLAIVLSLFKLRARKKRVRSKYIRDILTHRA